MFPAVGDTARLRKRMMEVDVRLFAQLSLDTNPAHLDEEFAATTRFGRRICHGMLYASLVSAVIGTQLPGPGSIYMNQSLKFHRPVFWGDEIEAVVTVTAVFPQRRVVVLATECLNQDGMLVLSGEATILAPG
jgi:acyl dehydratase